MEYTVFKNYVKIFLLLQYSRHSPNFKWLQHDFLKHIRINYKLIHTILIFVISSMAYVTPSRPSPLCLFSRRACDQRGRMVSAHGNSCIHVTVLLDNYMRIGPKLKGYALEPTFCLDFQRLRPEQPCAVPTHSPPTRTFYRLTMLSPEQELALVSNRKKK